MVENVELTLVDEEGLFFRAYAQEETFFYDGDLESPESPLVMALGEYYLTKAPKILLCQGFKTQRGDVYWQNEFATPYDDEGDVEIGERLFLVDDGGGRLYDELAYEMLSKGVLPEGWIVIERDLKGTIERGED